MEALINPCRCLVLSWIKEVTGTCRSRWHDIKMWDKAGRWSDMNCRHGSSKCKETHVACSGNRTSSSYNSKCTAYCMADIMISVLNFLVPWGRTRSCSYSRRVLFRAVHTAAYVRKCTSSTWHVRGSWQHGLICGPTGTVSTNTLGFAQVSEVPT
jgi:hypothetical protein